MSPGGHVRVWDPRGTEVMPAPAMSPTRGVAFEDEHLEGGLDLGARSLAYDGEEMDLGCVLDALFYGQAATT